jgi:hypothetical protein
MSELEKAATAAKAVFQQRRWMWRDKDEVHYCPNDSQLRATIQELVGVGVTEGSCEYG